MTTHTFEAEFEVVGPNAEELESAAGQLMDQLLALEAAGCGIHSSAVSLDLASGTVEVEVSVDHDDEEAAQAVSQSCIRAAIHATGGHTASWDVASDQVTSELIPA